MHRLSAEFAVFALLMVGVSAQELPKPVQVNLPEIKISKLTDLAEAVNELVTREEEQALAKQLAKLQALIAKAELRQQPPELLSQSAERAPAPAAKEPLASQVSKNPAPKTSQSRPVAKAPAPKQPVIPVRSRVYRNPEIGLIKSYALYGKRFNEWIDGTTSVQPDGVPIRKPSQKSLSQSTVANRSRRGSTNQPARPRNREKHRARRRIVSEHIENGMLVRKYSDGSIHRQRSLARR
ncbi:MAG: hypothetical protein CSA62_11795 [Planctomycetota bacterium]|nr:MAG: hypothetical protein CSA62_11795 [Planctomycetota bacterium]